MLLKYIAKITAAIRFVWTVLLMLCVGSAIGGCGSAPAAQSAPTSLLPTNVPPTSIPSSPVPPTSIPTSPVPPTNPPTSIPPVPTALVAVEPSPTDPPVPPAPSPVPPAPTEPPVPTALVAVEPSPTDPPALPEPSPVPPTSIPPSPTDAPPAPSPVPPEPQIGLRYVFPVQSSGNISYGEYHHDYPATDIFCPIGSAFVAPTSGVVDWISAEDAWDPATDDPAVRGGRSVAIIGDDGVRYYGSHLSAIADGLVAGQRVDAGQLLGLTGNSGDARSTPPHLHFGISRPTTPDDWQVRRGQISPFPYLNAWRNGEMMRPEL